MDTHPLNNLRVLKYLSSELGRSEEEKPQWYRHWVEQGFSALEKTLESTSVGKFCYDDSVTLADLCLIPQIYNAKRFDCPLHGFPLITSISDHCLTLDAFQAALPEAQGDYPG